MARSSTCCRAVAQVGGPALIGHVLVQHHPDLSADDRSALAQLAGEDVIVAPNPDLPAEVVATAGLCKRTCDGIDIAAIDQFITERKGKGPEQ